MTKHHDHVGAQLAPLPGFSTATYYRQDPTAPPQGCCVCAGPGNYVVSTGGPDGQPHELYAPLFGVVRVGMPYAIVCRDHVTESKERLRVAMEAGR